jgi:hypothetical protein
MAADYTLFFTPADGLLHNSHFYSQYAEGGKRAHHEQSQVIKAKAIASANYLNDAF